MISVRLVRGKGGAFKSCEARGHAGFAVRGSDIVCAAATFLLRTAAQVLSETDGMSLKVEAPERGVLYFYAEQKGDSPDVKARLVCAGDFIEKGVASLSAEYPDYVSLQSERE